MLLCSLGGYAADSLILTVDPSSPTFVVKLAANPTTGYQWSVATFDKKIFKMTGSHYAAPRTTLIGAGGEMIFTFALTKGQAYPKSTRMSFTYARPWQPKSESLKQVTINFKR